MKRLKFERLQHCITQQTLGIAARVPQSIISLIEVGRWNPTATELSALARALDVSPPEALLHDVVDAVVAHQPQPTQAHDGAGR